MANNGWDRLHPSRVSQLVTHQDPFLYHGPSFNAAFEEAVQANLKPRLEALVTQMSAMNNDLVDKLSRMKLNPPTITQSPEHLSTETLTLKFCPLNAEDLKQIDKYKNDWPALEKILHDLGPHYDQVKGATVRRRHDLTSARFELYVESMEAYQFLRKPVNSAEIPKALKLHTGCSLRTEKFYVLVEGLGQTDFEGMTQREYMEGRVKAWNAANGLDIKSAFMRAHRLILEFDNKIEAIKACQRLRFLNGIPTRFRPIWIQSIPIFCQRCGRPGHMNNIWSCELAKHSERLGVDMYRCLKCASHHQKILCPANSPPKCLNCDGNHNTESFACNNAEVKKHRATCAAQARALPLWAHGLVLPNLLDLPPQTEKPSQGKRPVGRPPNSKGKTEFVFAPNPPDNTPASTNQAGSKKRGRPRKDTVTKTAAHDGASASTNQGGSKRRGRPRKDTTTTTAATSPEPSTPDPERIASLRKRGAYGSKSNPITFEGTSEEDPIEISSGDEDPDWEASPSKPKPKNQNPMPKSPPKMSPREEFGPDCIDVALLSKGKEKGKEVQNSPAGPQRSDEDAEARVDTAGPRGAKRPKPDSWTDEGHFRSKTRKYLQRAGSMLSADSAWQSDISDSSASTPGVSANRLTRKIAQAVRNPLQVMKKKD